MHSFRNEYFTCLFKIQNVQVIQNDVIKCCKMMSSNVAKMMSPHSNEPATWRNCVSRRHFYNLPQDQGPNFTCIFIQNSNVVLFCPASLASHYCQSCSYNKLRAKKIQNRTQCSKGDFKDIKHISRTAADEIQNSSQFVCFVKRSQCSSPHVDEMKDITSH